MKELFALFGKINVMLWLVSGFRAFLYSLIVVGGSYRAAIAITPWSQMNHDQHVDLLVALFIVQAGVILTFLDQTTAKLSSMAKGSNPEPQTQIQNDTMKKIASIALISLALCAGFSARAQTDTNAPTTPLDVLNKATSYLSSVNTNLTWTNTPISLWTAANYQSGINTSAEIGASYDLWRPSANFAIAPEGVLRNAGVAGTIVSGQAGVGISLFHYDLKLTGYLDAGYNTVFESPFLEVGGRVLKKITTSTHAGVGLSFDKLFRGPKQNTPTVGAFLGWDF